MKELLNLIKPHISIIQSEMKKIGYDRVYIAEPMANSSEKFTFLVESDDEKHLPSQVAQSLLTIKIEELLGVPAFSCIIMRKSALENRLKTGEELDQLLYKKTVDSATLLCSPEQNNLSISTEKDSLRKRKSLSSEVFTKKTKLTKTNLYKFEFKLKQTVNLAQTQKSLDSPR